MSKEEILSQIYDMFEDGASVEEVAKHFENLQSQLDTANKKLDKIKELVNKYGYYTLSEIPDILSIIDGE